MRFSSCGRLGDSRKLGRSSRRNVDGAAVAAPSGRYAASVLHDENRNGRIDTNLIGIPTEGYGVTNNPKPKRRAATFDEATFTLPAAGANVTISLQYDFI